MNAVLTEPELVGLPLWGLVWSGMDFQALVVPDMGLGISILITLLLLLINV
ncbi:hypothetical protein [Xanthomarina gelatinilytica]|jgi:hypothetical protein|uniref:hypothetical protein n=1 Tax=Xanthomarina gelatinilytica TaxID=1137281 RepID=UPI003AA922BE